MTKYEVYNYGELVDGGDSYVGYTLIGRKVYRVSRRPGELPQLEETNMTVEEYNRIPLPEL